MDYSATLEQRVQAGEQHPHTPLSRDALIAALTSTWRLAPFLEENRDKMPRLKGQATIVIQRALANCQTSDIGSQDTYFYNLANKEPLKRILYGALNYDDTDVHLMPHLMNWEGAYFLAGLFHQKAARHVEQPQNRQRYEAQLRQQSTYGIVLATMKDGIRHVSKVHNNADGQYHTKKYIHSSAQLPYATPLLNLPNPPVCIPAPRSESMK